MNMITNLSSADLDRYRKIVAGIDGMDDGQKEEAIHVVYTMMQSFVDAAWGTHTVQIACQETARKTSRNAAEYGSVAPLGKAKAKRSKSGGANTKKPDEEPTP